MENLDCMNQDDLWEFWKKTNSVRPIRFARTLFPEKPQGYVSTTKCLGAYAANKSVAMKLRLDGNIQGAIVYENICDRIYRELPEYARW